MKRYMKEIKKYEKSHYLFDICSYLFCYWIIQLFSLLGGFATMYDFEKEFKILWTFFIIGVISVAGFLFFGAYSLLTWLF